MEFLCVLLPGIAGPGVSVLGSSLCLGEGKVFVAVYPTSLCFRGTECVVSCSYSNQPTRNASLCPGEGVGTYHGR